MRLPWWGAGLVAVAVSYAVLAAGFALANAATDPACGLPGGELLVAWLTLLAHPWLGFFAAGAWSRPRDIAKAFVYAFPVTIAGVAMAFVELGPPIPLFGEDACGEGDPQLLPSLLVVGVAAMVYARVVRRDGVPPAADT